MRYVTPTDIEEAVPPLVVQEAITLEPLSRDTNLTPVTCYVANVPNPRIEDCLIKPIYVTHGKYMRAHPKGATEWLYAWKKVEEVTFPQKCRGNLTGVEVVFTGLCEGTVTAKGDNDRDVGVHSKSWRPCTDTDMWTRVFDRTITRLEVPKEQDVNDWKSSLTSIKQFTTIEEALEEPLSIDMDLYIRCNGHTLKVIKK